MPNPSATLNQEAAHDAGLYDPSLHDNQIVALYHDNEEARAAQDVLVQSGFPATAIKVIARDEEGIDLETEAGEGYAKTASEGFWGAVKSLFVPDEDRSTFNHAVAHGHSMLVVTPDTTMDRHHLIHLIESTGPLDFDAKLEEWRQSGYDSSSAMTAATNPGTPAPAAPTPPGEIQTGYAPGRRDTSVGTGRVRSYYTDRDDVRTVEGRATPEPGANVAGNPNATPGATSSGMNSPRN